MTNDRDQVLEAEDRRRAALANLDIAALDALMADDLVHIHSSGLVHDKAALLAYILARGAAVSVERGPLEVRLYGDVAVITGRITNRMKGADGKEQVLDGIATQVLARQGGAWRFVSFQFTRLGP